MFKLCVGVVVIIIIISSSSSVIIIDRINKTLLVFIIVSYFSLVYYSV